MLKRFSHLSKNRLMQNFMKLFSATLFAQAFTIALSPILTRLYSPEEFGYYSIYTAIISLAIVYTTGRYEFAISTAKTIEESEQLFKLVVFLSMASSIMMFCIIFFFEDKFNQLAGFKQDYHILYYIPLTLLGLGIMQGINYYFNRTKNFSNISKAKIIQSVSNGGSSVLFAYLGFHNLGMIWANVLGVFIANLYNILGKKLGKLINIVNYNYYDIKKVAKIYNQYPLYNSTSAFFDTVALQAPILILNRFFSEVVVGFYSLTVRVIALPVTLISGAVAQIYLSELAEKENKGEKIDLLLKKAVKLLAFIGIVPVFLLVSFGPWLFELVFGEDWKKTGELAQILAFSYYAKFVVSPLSVVFYVKSAVRLLSKIQILRAISTVTVLYLSSRCFKNIDSVILVYVVHEIFFYLVYLVFIFKIASLSKND